MNSSLPRLILLHLIGNAVLLGLGYYWLSVGESSSSMLALSITVLLIFVAGEAWLHGSALAYFRDASQGAGLILRRVVRHLPALMLLTIAVLAIYTGLSVWNPSPMLLSVASFLTMTFQKPVRPAFLLQSWHVLLWLIEWCVLPVLLLPLAGGIAQRNWRGFSEFGSQVRNWRYWLITPILLLAGIWLPLWLAAWSPIKGAFGWEVTSLILRFGASYLLFVTACLLVAFITSRGRPILTQPSTVPSP